MRVSPMLAQLRGSAAMARPAFADSGRLGAGGQAKRHTGSYYRHIIELRTA